MKLVELELLSRIDATDRCRVRLDGKDIGTVRYRGIGPYGNPLPVDRAAELLRHCAGELVTAALADRPVSRLAVAMFFLGAAIEETAAYKAAQERMLMPWAGRGAP